MRRSGGIISTTRPFVKSRFVAIAMLIIIFFWRRPLVPFSHFKEV
jgi:hypothetical protein